MIIHLANRPSVRAFLLQKMLFGMLLLSIAVTAHAVPISGEIGFGGNFFAVDESWNTVSTDVATGIKFDPPQTIINYADGDFTGAATPGTIKDLQFVTFSSVIEDFWTVNVGGTIFAFDLTYVQRVASSDDTKFLTLEGTGVVTAAGFDNTAGTWSFTGDTTNPNGQGTFSWSAGTATVPLPAPVWILAAGLGLIGFKQRLTKHK